MILTYTDGEKLCYYVDGQNRILKDIKQMPAGNLLKKETREQIADSIWQVAEEVT